MGMRTLPVLVDRDQLTQASLNLLDNAIMHTPERGLVRLSGKREDSSVVLHLHNAQPFASKHLPDLFDRPLSRRIGCQPTDLQQIWQRKKPKVPRGSHVNRPVGQG